jgi:hypothetical protein
MNFRRTTAGVWPSLPPEFLDKLSALLLRSSAMSSVIGTDSKMLLGVFLEVEVFSVAAFLILLAASAGTGSVAGHVSSLPTGQRLLAIMRGRAYTYCGFRSTSPGQGPS